MRMCGGDSSSSASSSSTSSPANHHRRGRIMRGRGSGGGDGEGSPSSGAGDEGVLVVKSASSGGGGGMGSWAQRMHRRAATIGTVVTSCGHPDVPAYPPRLEKVKFGVPLEEVCRNDIPGPLLVMVLKLNKEGPWKKDVFRAPGHAANMKKLVHFLQTGRLVNIDNFSTYTIASVLKKLLRKLPGGVFGREGERSLFQLLQMDRLEDQRDHIHQLVTSLPVPTQHLLVLLFGTFRVIATNAERANTGMTSEALGVSVAPSFFHSCVSDGKQAKMEDVVRFKVATKIMKFLIDNFGVSNLFGRENYEYYARITGRILKVEEDWIFSFRYPPDALVSRHLSMEAEKTWLQYESERWGLRLDLEESLDGAGSSSAPLSGVGGGESGVGGGGGVSPVAGEAAGGSGSLGIIPENSLLGSYPRLSVSLEENGLFQGASGEAGGGGEGGGRSPSSSGSSSPHMTLEELKQVNRYAESTKSLSFLPQVHERQAARMRTRSEWFLSPLQLHQMHQQMTQQMHHLGVRPQSAILEADSDTSLHVLREETGLANQCQPQGMVMMHRGGLSASAESLKQLLRRTSSRDKDRRIPLRRGSSKKNKENGGRVRDVGGGGAVEGGAEVEGGGAGGGVKMEGGGAEMEVGGATGEAGGAGGGTSSEEPPITERDCTETDMHTFHITLTYKPRI